MTFNSDPADYSLRTRTRGLGLAGLPAERLCCERADKPSRYPEASAHTLTLTSGRGRHPAGAAPQSQPHRPPARSGRVRRLPHTGPMLPVCSPSQDCVRMNASTPDCGVRGHPSSSKQLFSLYETFYYVFPWLALSTTKMFCVPRCAAFCDTGSMSSVPLDSNFTYT